jgi:membrane-associated phospholipid phosphatase
MTVCLAFSCHLAAQTAPVVPPPVSAELGDGDLPFPPEPPSRESANAPGAQGGKTQAPSERCGVSALGRCLRDFLGDQAGIWTSPARIRSPDLLWILPFAGATGAAIATDRRALDTLGPERGLVRTSRHLSNIGSPYATVGASGVFYLIGSLGHHEKLRETGVLGVEAIADTAVVVEALKLATNRDRPNQDAGKGDFWPHGTRGYPSGTSFPSMHAAGSWALARVIAGEYPQPAVKILVYGLATTVSATRVMGRQHFPSDVLVGSTAGFLIGRHVLRHHAVAYRDKVAYTILPYTDTSTRSYGLSVAFQPESLRPEALERSFHSLASRLRKRSKQDQCQFRSDGL